MKVALWRAGSIITGIALLLTGAFTTPFANSSDDAPNPTPSPTVSAPPQSDGVTNLDGLPYVGGPDETLTSADTTSDPRTPATISASYGCETPANWTQLVNCIESANGELDWYVQAINDRADETGFGWSDIQSWASNPDLANSSQLAVTVFGGNWSDDEARAIAAELNVPGVDVSTLPVARFDSGQLVNTRLYSADGVAEDFLDLRQQVRVSLMPPIFNEDGSLAGVGGDSGVFADCFNIWRLAPPATVWPCMDDSCTPPPCPPGTEGTPPNCTPPPPPPVVEECPPGTEGTPPNCTTPPPPPPSSGKDPSLDPDAQGNAPVGAGQNQDSGPGPLTPRPAAPPAAPYVAPPPPAPAPPAPAPAPAPAPVPTPDPAPAPAPQPSAPTPTNPVDPGEGSGCAPGMTC